MSNESPILEPGIQIKPRKAKKEPVVDPLAEYNPERTWGVKKPRVAHRDPVVIVEPIDWEILSHQLTFAEYHELRKQHGLD